MPSYFILVWVLLIGFMFYFMMIKPQKRARVQQQALLQHLAPGAEVRTNAQIYGTVTEVGDEWVIIETTPGVKLKIGKPAILGIVLPDTEETADEVVEGVVEDAASAETQVLDVQDVQDKAADVVPAASEPAAEPAESTTKA